MLSIQEKYEFYSRSFSDFIFEEFPCLGMGVGREEGVVRVELEAPPFLVALVTVQPFLPSTSAFSVFIGVGWTFAGFCSLSSLILSYSFLLVHFLCFVYHDV